MRHRFIAVLLAVAGLFSIAVGVHHLRWHQSDRQSFERHVAEICVQAAERTCAKSCPSNSAQ